MQHISLIDERWPAVLAALPACLDLDKTARETGALLRRRGVGDAATLLRLALVYGPCGLSLRETAAWAELSGLASLSDVALLNRLRGATTWLEQIVGALLSSRIDGRCANKDLAPVGRSLRLVDGTCISQPGSKGTDWRVHVAYDLAGGRFSHFDVTDARGAEALQRAPVTPGEIRIADRYYAQAKGLRYVVDGGGDFIVRTGWRKLKLFRRDGTPFDLFAALDAVGDDGEGDFPIFVDRDMRRPSLPVRLIVLRKSAEAAEQERRRLRRYASKKGRKLDPRTLIAADYLLLVTSLDPSDFPADLVMSLYRLRWQIELAFKRLKSLGHIDRLPAKDAALARSWLYAHLILALLIDDLTQDFLDSPPCAGRWPQTSTLNLANSQDALRRAARCHPRRPRLPNYA